MEIYEKKIANIIRCWIMLDELKKHQAALAKHASASDRGLTSIVPDVDLDSITTIPRPELVPIRKNKI